jgi:hypothetical protein
MAKAREVEEILLAQLPWKHPIEALMLFCPEQYVSRVYQRKPLKGYCSCALTGMGWL